MSMLRGQGDLYQGRVKAFLSISDHLEQITIGLAAYNVFWESTGRRARGDYDPKEDVRLFKANWTLQSRHQVMTCRHLILGDPCMAIHIHG